MTEQVWLMLGPVGATMAILIFAMQKVLKNQADANREQMRLQSELNNNTIDRMDKLVKGIPEGNAHIESVIVNQFAASEGRLSGEIHELSTQLQRHSEVCAKHMAVRSAELKEGAGK